MFPVTMISGEPKWNSLPVAKIINYPLEKADYKPYAQARICLSEHNLYIQLLAFEVCPEETSTVSAAVCFYPDEEKKRFFRLSTDRSGNLSCKFVDEGANTETDVSKSIALRIYSGEDEQGIYWCSCFTLPLSAAEKLYGRAGLSDGMLMEGNFYKLCEGEKKHYGSFYPVDFTAENPFSSEFFAPLEPVKY